MSKVAVIYWSGTGNTETMANVLETSLKSNGAEVTLMTPDSLNLDVVKGADAVALGCPSMGSEVLEESEFEPLWQDLKSDLAGKKIGLFGSYGWGDGEWMRTWEDEARGASLNVVSTVICQETPDGEAETNLASLAKALV